VETFNNEFRARLSLVAAPSCSLTCSSGTRCNRCWSRGPFCFPVALGLGRTGMRLLTSTVMLTRRGVSSLGGASVESCHGERRKCSRSVSHVTSRRSAFFGSETATPPAFGWNPGRYICSTYTGKPVYPIRGNQFWYAPQSRWSSASASAVIS